MYTHIYIYIYIYIYVYTYLYRRFRGASPACPTPRNREIGFVSSSFLFRLCRACRTCERGEAKLRGCACVDRCPYRWAFLELVSTRSVVLGGGIFSSGAWALTKLAFILAPFVDLLLQTLWVLRS